MADTTTKAKAGRNKLSIANTAQGLPANMARHVDTSHSMGDQSHTTPTKLAEECKKRITPLHSPTIAKDELW
jgi:hypothetical protein